MGFSFELPRSASRRMFSWQRLCPSHHFFLYFAGNVHAEHCRFPVESTEAASLLPRCFLTSRDKSDSGSFGFGFCAMAAATITLDVMSNAFDDDAAPAIARETRSLRPASAKDVCGRCACGRAACGRPIRAQMPTWCCLCAKLGCTLRTDCAHAICDNWSSQAKDNEVFLFLRLRAR